MTCVLASTGSLPEDAFFHDLQTQVERLVALLPEASEYRQAAAEAPGLLQQERHLILDMLCAEDYHTLRAAKRLAKYWKTRYQIFGPDRWLLPMTQTGAGALTQAQVETLRTGYKAFTTTAAGDTVCITDLSRLPTQAQTADPAIIFYLNSVWNKPAYNNRDLSVVRGHTLFHVLSLGKKAETPTVNQRLTAPMVQTLMQAMPHPVTRVVVGRSAPPPGREHLLDYLTFQEELLTQNTFQMDATVINGPSDRTTLDALEKSGGLDRRCIPTSLGGDYCYQTHFQDWIRQRLSIENAMQAAPPVANANLAVQFLSSSQHWQPQVPLLTAPTTIPCDQDESSNQEASNDTNAVHDSHGKQRKHNPTTTSTAKQQARPTSTRKQSHGSSNQATTAAPAPLVERLPKESQLEFEKRRHLIYGKRSYHKKRAHWAQMEDECQELKATKRALQAEQERLQGLLAQAQTVILFATQNNNLQGRQSPLG